MDGAGGTVVSREVSTPRSDTVEMMRRTRATKINRRVPAGSGTLSARFAACKGAMRPAVCHEAVGQRARRIVLPGARSIRVCERSAVMYDGICPVLVEAIRVAQVTWPSLIDRHGDLGIPDKQLAAIDAGAPCTNGTRPCACLRLVWRWGRLGLITHVVELPLC
jgi:hypothetical protein